MIAGVIQPIFAGLLALSIAAPRISECAGSPRAPALDHVVLVVRDLDQVSTRFREHGFRMKQGRLHANNLLNRHVKFRDGSSLELMTVRGEPRDTMAHEYADLAASGEGGVYVAVSVSSIDGPMAAALALHLAPRRGASGPWQFVSFTSESPTAAVFFTAGGAAVQDPDSLVSHEPDVDGLAEAWVEGGTELIELLERLGATRCGQVQSPDGRTGERLGLSRGTLVVIPARAALRPRVLGVVLRTRVSTDRITKPHPNLWVRYEVDSR